MQRTNIPQEHKDYIVTLLADEKSFSAQQRNNPTFYIFLLFIPFILIFLLKILAPNLFPALSEIPDLYICIAFLALVVTIFATSKLSTKFNYRLNKMLSATTKYLNHNLHSLILHAEVQDTLPNKKKQQHYADFCTNLDTINHGATESFFISLMSVVDEAEFLINTNDDPEQRKEAISTKLDNITIPAS